MRSAAVLTCSKRAAAGEPRAGEPRTDEQAQGPIPVLPHGPHWTTIYGKPDLRLILLGYLKFWLILPQITWQLDDRVCLYIKEIALAAIIWIVWHGYFTHWTFCFSLLKCHLDVIKLLYRWFQNEEVLYNVFSSHLWSCSLHTWVGNLVRMFYL